MATTDRVLVTARYLVPMPGQVLEKHYLVIEDGRIVGIERFRDIDSSTVREVHDLGQAVLLPGLINAHTHLDTCHLHQRVPYESGRSGFTNWLEAFHAARKASRPDEIASGVRTGLQQAIEGGTTAIGDLTVTDASYSHLRQSGLRGVVWLEVFGFDPALTANSMDQLQNRMEQAVQREVATAKGGDSDASRRPLVRFGVAPNAPYTASRELYSATLRLMVERGDRFCTHLAETPDEHSLLQVCEGEFIPFLESMFPEGLPDIGCAASPVSYVAELLAGVRPDIPKDATARFRVIRPPVLVHCNYLDPDDITLIARLRAPVVFCPRHHAFFEHEQPHPVQDLLGRGQTVAIGTESLATNDTLSMLDEIRWLAASDYQLDNDTILRMATLYGARALDIEDQVGVLTPGMQADVTAVAIASGTPPDRVAHQVLHDTGPVVFTMVAGHTVFRADG